jgi:trans-aconitate 2-methyltransferase
MSHHTHYLDIKTLSEERMTHTWDPERYLTYADERGRPFVELVARVGADRPDDVVDLGCGPGTLTTLLRDRWPDARIRGLDSSPEMIARARGVDDSIEFAVADLRDWAHGVEPVDVLVSNATLQWIPGHLDLLPELAGRVRPGGWLAFQVPGNFDEPSHTIRRDLAAEAPYSEHTRGVAVPSSHDPAVYLEALAALGLSLDAWETTYLHVLTGPDPVFTWVSGTGARPTLQALPDDLRPGFEAEFKRRLREAYPERGGRVVLPFRRVFVVGRVATGSTSP